MTVHSAEFKRNKKKDFFHILALKRNCNCVNIGLYWHCVP